MEDLYHRLISDLRAIGITESFDLDLRPYSKTYFGRYDPNNNRITLYVYEDSERKKLYSYEELLMTTIHEAVHCIQWHDPTFIRRKGVMHNPDFHKLYNKYSDLAKSKLLLREVKYEKAHSEYSDCTGEFSGLLSQ